MNSLGNSLQELERWDNLNKIRKDLFTKCISILEKARQLDPSNQDVINTLKNIYNELSN